MVPRSASAGGDVDLVDFEMWKNLPRSIKNDDEQGKR